jgi:hypothetical protein
MKRATIAVAVAVVLSTEGLYKGPERAYLPHVHEDPRAPTGPNTYSKSFGINGASTTNLVVTAVRSDLMKLPLGPRYMYTD